MGKILIQKRILVKEVKNMMGIYRFYNEIENKSYIGQSIALENRYRQHFRYSVNKNDNGYYTDFYKAIRKYGFDNFRYEILEQKDYYSEEKLNEREKYWVEYYDSFKNGYNMNPGGELVTARGEEHPCSKLTEKQVIEIKEILRNNNKLTQREIAKKYGVEQSVISEINNGFAWSSVGITTYPIRNKSSLKTGTKSFAAIFSDKDVMDIRTRYIKESCREIYKDYQDRVSYSAFEKCARGGSYKNLPIYNKKENKWINI